MNWKTFVPLLLAIVLGLVAAKIAKDALNRKQAPAPQANLAQIVVTKHGVAPGQELTEADLQLAPADPATTPEQSFNNIAEVLDRTTKVEMTKGQAIVEPLLAEKGAGSGLQSLVPEGFRAITIEVNEFSGLSEMVTPGSRVDVVTTINASGNDEMTARTIVQNVKVTAVGQRVTAKRDPKDDPNQPEVFHSVTLLCTPDEAEAIELAATSSRPWLVLRGNKDDATVESSGVTLTALRGTKAGAFQKADPFVPVSNSSSTPTTRPSVVPVAIVTPVAENNTRSIEVIRGGTVSTVTVTLPTLKDGDITDTKDPTE
jgi:pilus assembly protein CpaB